MNSIDRIKNLTGILSSENDKILIVISAIGKTTNALEKVAEAFFKGDNEEALRLFESIKHHHQDTLKHLVTIGLKKAAEEMGNFFTE